MLKKIGFIGVGIMGKSMVRNLMRAGYEVSIYTRTKSKVEDVIAEGAVWMSTIRLLLLKARCGHYHCWIS